MGTLQNQAIRYLLHLVHQQRSRDPIIHNTLVSILASKTDDESQLLEYLHSQPAAQRNYDADYTLRVCIQNKKTQSCVYLYQSMGQSERAIDLALQHGDEDLAIEIADHAGGDPALRKKLWLSIAKKVIPESHGIKT